MVVLISECLQFKLRQTCTSLYPVWHSLPLRINWMTSRKSGKDNTLNKSWKQAEIRSTLNEIVSYNLSGPQLRLEDAVCKNWPLLTNRGQHIARVTANNRCCQLAQLAVAPLAKKVQELRAPAECWHCSLVSMLASVDSAADCYFFTFSWYL